MQDALCVIENNLKGFTDGNKISSVSELGQLFKSYDVARMQWAIGSAMLYTAKRFGSRGSAMVINGTDFMDRDAVPENAEGRACAVTVRLNNGALEIKEKAVKPLPERELWFEKVWNEHKKRTEK